MNCLIIIVIFGVVLFVNGENATINIPDGIIQGEVLKDFDGSRFYSFKSIPYAKPPIGEYRFRAAVKNDPWENVLSASSDSPLCSQPNPDESMEIGTEDCLYLNVFTPSLEPTDLKPVMVYIHGGKFVIGSASEFGADYIITEDIVLVTINYRLGVYGFMNFVHRDNTNNENELVTNNGFKDQVLALKWVQENIKFFGGNSKQVTIAGESAGGMSAHGHILSPLSKGLFHRAIVMSGTSINPWAYTANNTAINIAKYLNIDTTNEDSMINELKLATHDKLYEAMKNLMWFKIQLDSPCLTALVIENPGTNTFISTYPLKIMKSGNYNNVPMLIGNTNREGLLIHAIKEEYILDLKTHIPFFFKNKKDAEEEIKNFYGINITSDLNNISMYRDVWFKFNVFRTAHKHTKHDNKEDVYYYEFSGDGTLNYLKPILFPNSEYEGACHADELGYLYLCKGRAPCIKGSLEEKLMRTMTNIFGNFVKTGKPYKKWLPFTPYKYNFANITNDSLKIGVLDGEEFEFWTNMYEKYSNGLY